MRIGGGLLTSTPLCLCLRLRLRLRLHIRLRHPYPHLHNIFTKHKEKGGSQYFIQWKLSVNVLQNYMKNSTITPLLNVALPKRFAFMANPEC
jgi:hypothetical protein